MSEPPRLRIDCRNHLGEAPLWCAEAGILYWVDVIRPGRVFHWHAAGERIDFWDFDDLVTGLNLIPGGALLVHLKNRLVRFEPGTGTVTPIFSLPPSASSQRFNDGHCDRRGRLVVGTMPNNIADDGTALEIGERNGQIYLISDSSVRVTDAQLGCPNAICWSPDGATLYVADSCDGWLYSFRYGDSESTLSERRRFCHLEGMGVPDGAAVDRDGYIWNARWGAGAVVRIAPDGALDRVVRLPVSQPTACCFGDADLRTLYVTSARYALSAAQLRDEPLAGSLFSIRLDVAGVEVHPFFTAAA